MSTADFRRSENATKWQTPIPYRIMSSREFIRVYVPTLIAAVFMVAITPGDGGVSQWAGGHTGAKGLLAIVGFLSGIALPMVILSFGVGAVVWLLIYLFRSDTPSYLRFVKNTLLVIAVISMISMVGGFCSSLDGTNINFFDWKANVPGAGSAEDNRVEEGELEVVRDSNGNPIKLEPYKEKN